MLRNLPAIVHAAAEPLTEASITLVGDSVSPIAKGAGSTVVSTMELIQGTTGIDLAGMISSLGSSGTPKPADSSE